MIYKSIMRKFLSNSGQTLIEAIAAIGIILTGIFAIVSLSIATISAGRLSEFSFIASDLSREGIEVVRAMRDTNWLERERGVLEDGEIRRAWDHGLVGEGGDSSAVAKFDPEQNQWALDFSPVDFDSCVQDNTCRLYKTTDNAYVHVKENTTASPFYRLLKLYEICADGAVMPANGSCPVTNIKVGKEIHSITRWKESNRWEQVELIERIYNWKVGG